MSESTFAWCPYCKRWVPADKMEYDEEIRMCSWCSSDEVTPTRYVYDPYHESTMCIYCDSYHTKSIEVVDVQEGIHKYKCMDCGEEFVV